MPRPRRLGWLIGLAVAEQERRQRRQAPRSHGMNIGPYDRGHGAHTLGLALRTLHARSWHVSSPRHGVQCDGPELVSMICGPSRSGLVGGSWLAPGTRRGSCRATRRRTRHNRHRRNGRTMPSTCLDAGQAREPISGGHAGPHPANPADLGPSRPPHDVPMPQQKHRRQTGTGGGSPLVHLVPVSGGSGFTGAPEGLSRAGRFGLPFRAALSSTGTSERLRTGYWP
jgi:hypothetical protein